MNTSLVAAIGLSVIGNIVYNFLKDRNNGTVTVKMIEMLKDMQTVREKQEVTQTTLDKLRDEAIKQTSLLEQLVQRDSSSRR